MINPYTGDKEHYNALTGTGFLIVSGRGPLFHICPGCHGEIGYGMPETVLTPGYRFYHPVCFFKSKRGQKMVKDYEAKKLSELSKMTEAA